MRKKVFKTAWSILKAGFAISFAEALKKAWTIIKITLGNGTPITYATVNGEERNAIAMQVGSLETINRGFIRYIEIIDETVQWRSFRITNLITL